MHEATDRPMAPKAKRSTIVVRTRDYSVIAWRATGRMKARASQAKLAAHRRVEPFWPATGISILVTLAFYIWTLQMIGVQYAWAVGCFAIGSSLIQEVGHWQAMNRAGYRAHFLFLPWLVWLLPKDPEQYAKASRWHKSLVAVTGPAINVMLMLVGLLLTLLPGRHDAHMLLEALNAYATTRPGLWITLYDSRLIQAVESGIAIIPDWRTFGLVLASVNAGIATMSLLPIPFLDGGKLLKNLLESVGVVHDRLIAGTVGIVVLTIAIILFLLGHFHPYPVAAILGTGWLLQRHRQEAHHQTEAMTTRQAMTIFAVWLLLFSISLTVFLIVPASVQPENTKRALEILTNLWRSLT